MNIRHDGRSARSRRARSEDLPRPGRGEGHTDHGERRLDLLATGMTEEQIVADYPTLTTEGIRAAAAYGAELARNECPAVAAP